MNNPSIDPGSLVGSAEVDGRVYTDQGVFNLEMEKIFGATWVYVGHESQLSEPGAYIATDIGAKPVILVKDSAHQLRAFHNRCPHKGSRLVNNAGGKMDRFLCNFHNYSFNLDGSVAAIPLEDAYENSGFGACEKVARMVSVPHVESYRGFIFAALKQPPMDLRSWLSDTRASIDNLVDRSPEGRLEVVGRPFKWINHCNWKMLVENLVDGMHVGGTHPSIGQTATKFSNDLKKNNQPASQLVEMARSFWQSAEWIRDFGCTVLANGHSYNGGKVSIHSQYDEIPGYAEALKKAYGEARTNDILSLQRHNTCIYPNLHVKCLIQKIRVFKPIAPNKTVVEAWVFRLAGAPDALLQRSMEYAQMLDSPATLVSVDDHEVMIRAQKGLEGDVGAPVSMHRGRTRPVTEDENGIHCEGDSERAFVSQYEMWQKLMTGEV